MSFTECDAELEDFYDRLSDELYPEHKEQAIGEFIGDRMVSYFLNNPNIIEKAYDCFSHATNIEPHSSRCALIMYATTIELYLKSVLLKPIVYGMVHNENIAGMIAEVTLKQTGFSRYNKLLNALCENISGVELAKVKGLSGKPILEEAGDVQAMRNRIVHQGIDILPIDVQKARNIAVLILTKVIEPVLKRLDLVVTTNSDGKGLIVPQ